MSNDTVYRTVSGAEIQLRPVSQVLIGRIKSDTEARLREEGLPLDPPTYTVTTATGEKEVHAHDEASLETDADREAWSAHQAARVRLSAEVNRQVTKVMLSRGIVIDGPPPEWAEEMRAIGVRVPEDPTDQLLDYLTMEILITPADVQGAMTKIMQLSMAGLPAEKIAAVEGLFRRQVAGNAPVPAADGEGGVVVQPGPGGDADGPGVGAAAE